MPTEAAAYNDVQEEVVGVSSARIQFLAFKGKQILLVDFSGLSADEVERTARAVPEVVTTRARASVLLLVDFTGAAFDQEALRAMKEAAVFNKPYIKRSAWIGAESFPEDSRHSLRTFSGREFPIFKSRAEALEWLAAE